MSNPALWPAPGESAEVPLASDLVAHVVRGRAPGPVVWAWAPRGDVDPSMAQALGELRDELDARELAGAVGLLLDGPPPPLPAPGGFREEYAWEAPVRALSDGAAAVVLCESIMPGYQAAPHVALDLDDEPARQVARKLGARFLAPQVVSPAPDRRVLAAPTVTWLDGESERLERAVVDRCAGALRSLLRGLGMLPGRAASPDLRVVLRAVAEVVSDGPGLVELAVPPGGLVRAGEVAAWVGAPGLRARRALRAPATGVVLWGRAGHQIGGSVLGIGKLRRTLPEVTRALAPVADGALDVGWCERVDLPDLGVAGLPAKLDTGARTSALHVAHLREDGWTADGRPVLAFDVPVDRHGRTRAARAEVVEYTWVRDSGGHEDRRPVIETTLRLGRRPGAPVRRVRISLTDRGDMQFPMLIGRTALDHVRVDPTARYLLG